MVPTPRYVLLDGDKPVGTFLVSEPNEVAEKTIFGFSDKPQYDAFRANSELAYKPYPLVKGFLRGQMEQKEDAVALVAIDASGPKDESFQVCSVEQTLRAYESNANTLESVSARV